MTFCGTLEQVRFYFRVFFFHIFKKSLTALFNFALAVDRNSVNDFFVCGLTWVRGLVNSQIFIFMSY